MQTWEWIVVAAAGAVAVLLLLALVRIRRRRSHLKERFGPEYHRAVSAAGVGSAERQLTRVEQRREELDIRTLPSAARHRYLDELRYVEARFVSDPQEAARAGERLVERALEESGYPLDEDVERRIALVAVDHPDIAERYRHGHAMCDGAGDASTESLRKAMLDFRAVLEELLQTPQATGEETERSRTPEPAGRP